MSALCHTSASIWPKRSPIKNCLSIRTITMSIVDEIVENQTSCVAEFCALSNCLSPRYWPATTAPPVARAGIKKSTRETPDIAASPSDATIIESARPTKNSRAYSISNGIKRYNKALFVYK